MQLLKYCSGCFLIGFILISIQCTGLFDPTDAPDTTDDISFSVNRTGTARPSSPYTLKGIVNSLEGLDSIIVSFYDYKDILYDETAILNLSGSTSYDLEDSDIELAVNSSDCNGTYTVKVVAYSTVEKRSVTIDIDVENATNCSTDKPVLTLGTLSGSSSVTPGSPRELTGSYSCTGCDASVSFEVTVKDSLDAIVTDNTVTAEVTNKGSDTYTVTVEATNGACNGTYTIVIDAESGSLSETVTKTVTVTGAFNCGVQTGDLEISELLVLGAQNASEGSSLDIDSFKVHTINNARTVDTAVDLITGYFDAMMFGSPEWAFDSSLAVAKGWTGYLTSGFHELTLNIDLKTATQIELQSLWTVAPIADPNVKLTSGKQYITATSQGAIAVIEVVELSNSISGTVSIRIGRTRKGATDAPELFIPEGLIFSATLTVGADENSTYGSSIDLDEPKVMLASAARDASATVDLVYVHSFSTNEDVLSAPTWADDSEFSFVSGWSTYNETKFYKLTGTDFESITTKEELEALWQETLAIDPSVHVETDDLVIAKTDQGTTVLIRIISYEPGDTGQIEIKVGK